MKKWHIFVLLLIACQVEAYCMKKVFVSPDDARWVSVLYLAMGLFIACLPVLRVSPRLPALVIDNRSYFKINTYLSWGFLFYLIYLVVYFGKPALDALPIDPVRADMLPILKVMSARFIQGKAIYDIIPEIWGGMQPIYLPAMWAPFVPFEYMGIDVRWMCLAFIVAGLALFIRLTPDARKLIFYPLAMLPMYVVIINLVKENTPVISLTEEGIVMGYYLLLGFALMKKNPVLIGIAISLCLLSRFIIVFWAPVYVIYTWLYVSRKQAYIMSAVVALMVLTLFVLPFGWERVIYFLNLPGNYVEFARRVWSTEPYHIYSTLGLAKFFSPERIPLLHRLVVSFSLLTPLLCLGLYHFLKNRIDPAFWGICSLKLTLLFFFNLLEVPYLYLFYTSTLLSSGILLYYLSSLSWSVATENSSLSSKG